VAAGAGNISAGVAADSGAVDADLVQAARLRARMMSTSWTKVVRDFIFSSKLKKDGYFKGVGGLK
jgi:hypothetical protein